MARAVRGQAAVAALGALLLMAAFLPAVNAQSPLPDAETCKKQGEALNAMSVGVDVYSSCAPFLLWFSSNRDGCCNKLNSLVGPGAPLAYCLCDAEAASFVTDKLADIGINVAELETMCASRGLYVPFNNNFECSANT